MIYVKCRWTIVEILIRHFYQAETSFQFCKNYSNYTVVNKIDRNFFYFGILRVLFLFSFYSVDLVQCGPVLMSNLWFYIWQMLHHSFYIVNIVFLYSAYSVCANIAVYFLAGMFGVCLLPFNIRLLNTPRPFSISTTPSGQVSMLRARKALTPLKHAHTMSTGLYISLLLLRLCFTPHLYCFLFCWHLTRCFHQPLSG